MIYLRLITFSKKIKLKTQNIIYNKILCIQYKKIIIKIDKKHYNKSKKR